MISKVAAFIRQLSLFDKIEEVTLTSHPAFQSLCIGPYAHIEILVKPRLWESWRVVWSRRKESLRIEIPGYLAEAPEEIKLALLQWALLVSKRGMKRDRNLKLERSKLEIQIRQYLRAPTSDPTSALHAKLSARNLRKRTRLTPQGQYHDLDASFRRVNAHYFENLLHASVTWSARLGGLSTHSLAQNEVGQSYHLISISRGYDHPEVTPEILDGVMYHECLHAAIPPEVRNGRRIVHGSEFRRRERAYEHFEIWRNWHRHGLPKSLRQKRRLGLPRF